MHKTGPQMIPKQTYSRTDIEVRFVPGSLVIKLKFKTYTALSKYKQTIMLPILIIRSLYAKQNIILRDSFVLYL